jgi:hypothetical protein
MMLGRESLRTISERRLQLDASGERSPSGIVEIAVAQTPAAYSVLSGRSGRRGAHSDGRWLRASSKAFWRCRFARGIEDRRSGYTEEAAVRRCTPGDQ